jgi:AcrR family transcriptional regulator
MTRGQGAVRVTLGRGADDMEIIAGGVSRDRNRTAAALLSAARDLILERGFAEFGVNAVARRAGCDKQLIYRYFGGLAGLLGELAAPLPGWIDAVSPVRLPRAQTYAEATERSLTAFLLALRSDRLVQRILGWRLATDDPAIIALGDVCLAAFVRRTEQDRGNLQPPPGLDADAINKVLIAAAQHLALAPASGGIVLRSEQDWKRIERMVTQIARQMLGAVNTGGRYLWRAKS